MLQVFSKSLNKRKLLVYLWGCTNLVFRYKDWTLYKGNIILNDGSTKPTYFFSKHDPFKCIPTDLPEGYGVGFNERIGLPFLERKISEFDEE